MARETSVSIAVLFAAMFVALVVILPSNSASAAVARETSALIASVFDETAESRLLIAPVIVVASPAF